MGVFMKLKILLWILYIFFKSCKKKKKGKILPESGTLKKRAVTVGLHSDKSRLLHISLFNDWWALLTDSLRLGILYVPHASRPIMANNDSVKGGTYRETGGFGQKQQCVSAGVNNKILKHTPSLAQNF